VRLFPVVFAAAFLPSLLAQPTYYRHNIQLGVGAGMPRLDLQPFFANSPSFVISYGYRFHPNFQAEVGLDTVFGAGRVKDFLFLEGLYPLRIRDYQFFLPFGGRAILPLREERVHIFGGGGGAYLRYTEMLRQPSSYFRISCPVCGARDGIGYYALAGVTVAVDQAQHFRLGFTTKMYRGGTAGEPVGQLAVFETRDQWLVLLGNFTISF